MEDRKPLRRSKELVPLSREHHGGLLLCWKIRMGLAAQIEPGRIAKYLINYFNKDLRPHFEKEELYLFPLLPVGDPMRKFAGRQHTELYDLVARLENGGEGHSTIGEFEKLLEQHIRYEERELFPFIERHVAPDALAKASMQMNEYSHDCTYEEQWNDNFWTKNQ